MNSFGLSDMDNPTENVLTTVRIYGPVSTREIWELIVIGRTQVVSSTKTLYEGGFLSIVNNNDGIRRWEVTRKGRRKFLEIARKLKENRQAKE